MKTLATLALLAALSGCGVKYSTNDCELIEAPYFETDDLAGAWYDMAAKACKFDMHKPGCRGRDPDGFYNADRKECK